MVSQHDKVIFRFSSRLKHSRSRQCHAIPRPCSEVSCTISGPYGKQKNVPESRWSLRAGNRPTVTKLVVEPYTPVSPASPSPLAALLQRCCVSLLRQRWLYADKVLIVSFHWPASTYSGAPATMAEKSEKFKSLPDRKRSFACVFGRCLASNLNCTSFPLHPNPPHHFSTSQRSSIYNQSCCVESLFHLLTFIPFISSQPPQCLPFLVPFTALRSRLARSSSPLVWRFLPL